MSAFQVLIDRHGDRLFHFLRHKAASWEDAEEVTQNTFVTAFRKIDRYRSQYAFATWLYAIARRQVIDHYRRNRKRLEHEHTDAAPDDIDQRTPDEDIVENEAHAQFWDRVRETVTSDQFTALWLKYEEEFPVADIAVTMKKSTTNVKVMLHRARKRLVANAALFGRETASASIDQSPNILISQSQP